MTTRGDRIRTWIAARPLGRAVVIPAVCCLAFTAGALLLQAQASLGLSDLWIRFPDGTVQTTAAHNCSSPADPADEMIRVGGVCIDKYEASVWSQPDGGTQYGTASDDYPCSDNGQDCFGLIYARSVPGVQPSGDITWFQAAAALANAGKRLPHNIEWQQAVQGTPDNILCNITLGSASNTGSLPNCVSDWGAFDMVGNLREWVADWVPLSTACPGWGSFSDDDMCLSGASTSASGPGALLRGGDFGVGFGCGSDPGPFAVDGSSQPWGADPCVGFRGAR